MELFALNRKRIFESELEGWAFLQGGKNTSRYDTDRDHLFRQESNFFWLTGIVEGDCDLIMDFTNKKVIVFCTKLPQAYAVWLGPIPTLKELSEKYGLDFFYQEELANFVKTNSITKFHVHTTYTKQKELEEIETDDSVLKETLNELRVIKTELELEKMRKVCKIGSIGHTKVMETTKPNQFQYELQGTLLHEYYRHGSRFTSFEAIVGSGIGSSILHYFNNNLKINDGDLVLLDSGCEVDCYGSDITRTFPANGVFSQDQKMIYQIVLDMQKKCIEAMKPEKEWTEIHALSVEVCIDGLLECGLIKGKKEELIENHIAALFYPHGLGHMLGLDVHDVGGYPKGREKIKNATFQYLRANRKLKPGMILTVEPGIYFIRPLLEPAFEDPEVNKYLNVDKIKKFLDFGGIRIEDDVLVTETGYEVLTDVPKEIEDIEKLMKK
ncbi:xaa-pro dipeptidase [Anaeramoeba flamelloides]|uniref:Xaa-pro dipeptidase n=1 Tax=Anaeramoeba flamelloides TaxID=1746091 RepID=A0AAV7YV04_9EUKA|nr:xaa-pro dipeptidase [Anaeramoeba flamelloides]